MGFFYQDDDEDEFEYERHSFSPRVGTMIAVVSGVILAILLIVLAVNRNRTRINDARSSLSASNKQNTAASAELSESYDYDRTGKDVEQLYRDGKLRAEDLDIWDMYGSGAGVVTVDRQTPEPEETQNPDILPPYEIPGTASPAPSIEPEATPSMEPGAMPSAEPDKAFLKDVKRNDIDYTALRIVNDQMTYSYNGEVTSKLGVMLSQESGSVDFSALRDAGIEFVMLQVGFRGYDSGICLIDNMFERNIRGATEAGLGVGLTFSSRAVTAQEAIEEAHCCMDTAKGYTVTYPVAFVFEGKLLSEARTDSLDQEDRTEILEAFLNELGSYGYTPMIYGTEQYLLSEIIPDKLLTRYDVFLYDTSNIPNYPYLYKLWRYRAEETIPGVEKKASYVISFVDYSGR